MEKDFVQAKRDAVKKASGGWDGDKVSSVIRQTLCSKELQNKTGLNKMSVFDAATDGMYYETGMHFTDVVNSQSPIPANYAVIKDDGNLHFCLKFPAFIGQGKKLDKIEESLTEKLKKDGGAVYSQLYHARNGKDFGEIIFSPLIEGKQIDKVFDTKAKVQEIVKKRLNDLVLVAGDDKNDIRMLNFFEYIEDSADKETFSAERLKKIYDLPLISIFVDNSKGKENCADCGIGEISYSKIDNFFNSDGNVRFIHVVPENTVGKPQTLQEGVQVAIKEYAKRNKAFRKNLPKEMRDLTDNMSYEYPIDKSVSEELERQFGQKLWKPVKGNSFIKKAVIIGAAVAIAIGLALLIIRKIKHNNLKNKSFSQGINFDTFKKSISQLPAASETLNCTPLKTQKKAVN
ncbi:hypothetical protein II906_08235 [bacterium]|nr:hypothetical protein [bacterium]